MKNEEIKYRDILSVMGRKGPGDMQYTVWKSSEIPTTHLRQVSCGAPSPACYPATGCLGGLSSLFREWQKIPGVPQNFESLSQHAMRAVNQELQLQNFMTFIESSDFCTISNVLFFPLSWVIRKIDTTK